MNQYINQFKKYLQAEKNVSVHTLRNYSIDMEQFEKFLTTTNLCPDESGSDIDIKKIDNVVIRTFLGSLHKGGICNNSMARKLSTLRTFFKYLCREGYIQKNPARLVATPKVPKKIPSFLPIDEAFRL